MNKVNKITICREAYLTQEDFKNGIKDAIMVLLQNEYIMTVRYDEHGLGIVCIDFETDDESVGCPYPYWLTPEQWESVVVNDEEN